MCVWVRVFTKPVCVLQYATTGEPPPPPHTHTQEILLEFHYDELVSTRKLRSQGGCQYVDIKHGNLMQQNILRCETPYVSTMRRGWGGLHLDILSRGVKVVC